LERSSDDPFKGDESRKDDHDDADEGDAKEHIVHDAAFPYSPHRTYLLCQHVDGEIVPSKTASDPFCHALCLALYTAIRQ
jgi:hypothetical protein